jgi:hypothetical protein
MYNVDMTKTVKEKKDLYIDFSEEEIAAMGWADKQRLSIDVNADNSITVKPWVKMDIDISSFSKEVLEFLVAQSLEQDIPVNDVIVNSLKIQLNMQLHANGKEELICG